MKDYKKYSQNIDMLTAFCNLLKDKRNIRCVPLGTKTIKCYILTSEGERWLKLEEVGTRMRNIVEELEKEVLDLRKENVELSRIEEEYDMLNWRANKEKKNTSPVV